MKYHTINSTAISGIGYDEETGQMEVIFATGATAMHEGVTKDKFDTFMAAKKQRPGVLGNVPGKEKRST